MDFNAGNQQLRSKSARSQTQEEMQKQQECLNKIQQKNMELFNYCQNQ